MKKILILFSVLAIIIVGLFVLRGEEDTWLCEQGEWIKHGQPAKPKPVEPCDSNTKNIAENQGLFEILDKAKQINQDSKTLDLSNQGLTTIATEFFENKNNIEIFDVSNNLLTGALPAEIRKMTSLKILRASYNKLTGIPAEIGQLDNLEILDFSYNKLDTMPNEIVNLADTLQQLDLTGNLYSPKQLEAFEVLLPITKILY